MFRNLLSLFSPAFNVRVLPQGRRGLSHMSVHSAFPATLYRFQLQRESKLYDKKFDRDDMEWEDGVEVADDGLIHSKITVKVSNGALFMPNTPFMQELTRQSFNNYLDALDNDQGAVAHPHYLSISKGKV